MSCCWRTLLENAPGVYLINNITILSVELCLSAYQQQGRKFMLSIFFINFYLSFLYSSSLSYELHPLSGLSRPAPYLSEDTIPHALNFCHIRCWEKSPLRI